MKVDGDDIELSTGKTFYAHGTILGLALRDSGIGTPRLRELYNGYDGIADCAWTGGPEYGTETVEPPFTPEERREIADAMIARWSEWAEGKW